MRNIRVRYEKTGMIRFTSHLDTMRAFSRAFNRTDIDIYYTEGFNPHPYLVLGLPLSLGFETECDICDFRVNNEEALTDIVIKLQRALPPGIQIISAAEPKFSLGKIAFVRYRTVLQREKDYREEDVAALKSFFDREEILIEKKSKKGMQTVNIRPLIDRVDVELNREGSIVIQSVLSSGEGSLNPDLMVKAAFQYMGDLSTDNVRHKRLAILTADKEIFA